MNLYNGILNWDLKNLSKALNLTESETIEYFTDGRRVSFILERRLANEVLKGTLAPSEGAGYDLIDTNGDKWEVRSISKSGVYFCPSVMVGAGRQFNENGFLNKLKEIKGYILSDINEFPSIPYWIVNKEMVEKWYFSNQLGAGTKVSRLNILRLLRNV